MTATISDHIRYWSANRGSCVAVEMDGTALTWRALDRGSDELAAGLLAAGIKPGDRIAVLLNTSLVFAELVAACVKAGIILCPLNVRLTPYELLHQIRDADCRAIVTERALGDKLHAIAGDLADITIYCRDGDTGRHFDQLRMTGAAAIDLPCPGDGLFLCYTSGTTGLPKAALLSGQGVRGAGLAKQIADGVTFRDITLSIAPLCLTGGIVTNLTQIGFLVGAPVIFGNPGDPEASLELILRRGVTTMAMVASMLERMIDTPLFARSDLRQLTHVTTGGPELTAELIACWADRGVSLDPSFGQTEASSVVTWSRRSEMGDRLRASGRAIPHTSVRIVDADENEVPSGEAGEITVRGPGVMLGYWNRPDATAETLRGGWLHTGDIGRVDEEGYLYVLDRKKDMFRSGGLNVYPAEVEQVLAGVLPIGTDFAVVGVPDKTWGEVGLLVMAGNVEIDLTAIRALMSERLARFKQPRFAVRSNTPLPRNANGKIRKVELRDRYAQQHAEFTQLA